MRCLMSSLERGTIPFGTGKDMMTGRGRVLVERWEVEDGRTRVERRKHDSERVLLY